MQTSIDEIQKLGEKLQELVTEARPLLKDLNHGLREWKRVEQDIERALNMTMEKAKEAAELYRLCKGLDRVISTKLDNILINAKMVDIELRRLNELHSKIQKEISNSVGEYAEHLSDQAITIRKEHI
jgi:rubrerythrin